MRSVGFVNSSCELNERGIELNQADMWVGVCVCARAFYGRVSNVCTRVCVHAYAHAHELYWG